MLVCSSGVPVPFFLCRLWLLGAVEVLSHVVESGFFLNRLHRVCVSAVVS